MHSLLKRQLRRHFNDRIIPPEMAEFLEFVDQAYHEFDTDRLMLERSLDLSSRELLQANSEMRAVFKAFPDLFFRLDSTGTILDCRGGSPDEFALSPEKLIGKRIQDVPFPSAARAFSEALRRARGSSTPVSVEYVLDVGGREAVYEARLLRGLEDQVVAMVRNITERKRAAEELGRQQAFLRQVIDLNPGFIFARDREGRFTLVNQAVAEAYGATVEEMLGRTDAEMGASPEIAERFHRDDLEVMDTLRERFIAEDHVTDASGAVRWLQTIKRPILDPDGSCSQVLCVSADITKRKLAEDRLQRRTELILRKQAALQELAHLADPDLPTALERITSVAARTLEVELVAVWLFNEDRSALVCAHACGEGVPVGGRLPPVAAADYRAYFAALENDRVIAVNDVSIDAMTRDLDEARFQRDGITSLLDVPIRVRGRVVGVLSMQHRGSPRSWTLDDQDLALAIADFLILSLEVAKRRQVEDQLRQSQKMEAIGLLAGGVAHDFNNLLNVITGYTDLARGNLPPEHPAAEDLGNVLAATRRASDLARKLLAFSRKQVLEVEPFDLNGLLEDFTNLIGRIMGEDVDVVIRKATGPLIVNGDRSQIDQLLLNLTTNARQAMPEGGRLTIATERVRLGEETARARGLRAAGDYVELSVADEGVGMPPEQLSRVWEPFYSSRETGTGLGLSVVYGIVEQHGGAVAAESLVGRGSRFRVFLPLVQGPAPGLLVAATKETATGSEKIIVAEDESLLRNMVAKGLTKLGYEVLKARDGEEAVSLLEANPDTALVVLDVVMPRLSGPEAYVRMREIHPGLKAVFASGYAPDGIWMSELVTEGEAVFVPKPFVMEAMAGTIRRLLDWGLLARTDA